MINRIVKMKFDKNSLETFKQLFEKVKNQIMLFPGCHSVKLLQDINDPCVFLTYSLWDTEESLNTYRKSAFFDDTWRTTKALFIDKPEARSFIEQ